MSYETETETIEEGKVGGKGERKKERSDKIKKNERGFLNYLISYLFFFKY